MEKKLNKGVRAAFKKQQDYILKEARKLLKKHEKDYSVKNLDDDIEIILEGLDDQEFNEAVIDGAENSMKLGADYRIKKHSLAKIGIDFTLRHPAAIEFFKTEQPLRLANMSDTTKGQIKPILKEAVKEGRAYTEVADIIAGDFVFSPVRSIMIAVHEIGDAYEYGNMVPIKDAIAKGHDATKQWSTVKDSRVTKECKANEGQGWIKFSKKFKSGDDRPPRDGNPRCRCTALYDVEINI